MVIFEIISKIICTQKNSNEFIGKWIISADTIGYKDYVIGKPIDRQNAFKTLEFLSTHGIECPNSFGDPALLLPRYYSPFFQRKKYKLGIIPHVIDLDFDVINKIRETQTDILIIDLAHYEKWTDVIDQICSCEIIASSSLHGLIVSDAYNIPNCWITLSGKISGGLFKFYDYFSSVNRKDSEPIKIEKISDLLQVYKQVSLWKSIEIDTDEIIKCCPFLNK